MESLGIFIFLTMVLYIDYKLYLKSNDALFFKDKSDLEKLQRQYQKLKLDKKIAQLTKNNIDDKKDIN